ncbi:MAG: hypothetical protein JXQ93_08380 [Flavobacteriaceae bacterium]
MNKRIVILVFLGLFYNPFVSFSQDSIPEAKDISEEKELTFQQFFFKALSEKAITNYKKAIRNLEKCDEILPNNTSVFFEFSKNYLLLNKTFEAKDYIKKALQKKPKDIWMLSHLVEIYKKERDFKKAIEIQEKIVTLNSSKREALVYLYLQDRSYQKAIALMNVLASEKGLSRNLRRIKSSLEKRKPDLLEKKSIANDLSGLIESFKNNASFNTLKLLLEKAYLENKNIFNTYSDQAVSLFPAQPFVYLMRGKSLNNQKLYKKALSILESGIDFVIDNQSLEADFYEEISNAYLGMNNSLKAAEFKNKAKKLRAIK